MYVCVYAEHSAFGLRPYITIMVSNPFIMKSSSSPYLFSIALPYSQLWELYVPI